MRKRARTHSLNHDGFEKPRCCTRSTGSLPNWAIKFNDVKKGVGSKEEQGPQESAVVGRQTGEHETETRYKNVANDEILWVGFQTQKRIEYFGVVNRYVESLQTSQQCHGSWRWILFTETEVATLAIQVGQGREGCDELERLVFSFEHDLGRFDMLNGLETCHQSGVGRLV